TPGSALPALTLRNSDTTLVSSRYIVVARSAEIGYTQPNVQPWRVKVDIRRFRHGQRLGQCVLLTGQLLVLPVAQQDVCGLAAISDDHRPRQRCPLGAAKVLVEFAAGKCGDHESILILSIMW